MEREIEHQLLAWKAQLAPIHILLSGARQVGKTYLYERKEEPFWRSHFVGATWFEDKVLSVPFYTIGELERLTRAI